MSPLFVQQQALLAEKIRVLRRICDGLAWSLERLPNTANAHMDDPAVAERRAAIVDRFCKLQDQLAGAMLHAHAMLGGKQRNFHDVIVWAVSEGILPDETTWLELRSLRNRMTHEYDPQSHVMLELMTLVRDSAPTLATALVRLESCSQERGILAADD